MTYPVAMLPYINAAPYREAGCPPGCRFVPLVPTASVAALIRGTVLAAAVPVGALARLGNLVRPLGPYGIAARERSLSVLLFSDLPLDRMTSGDDIRITSESASSTRLLELLLALNGRPQQAVHAGDPARPRGELVIGDRALVRLFGRQRTDNGRFSDYPVVTDLAAAWYQRFLLPFVFARWVVRNDAPRRCVDTLCAWLARFAADETRYVARAVSPAARAAGLPEAFVVRYFEVIRRCLTDEDLSGQALFTELMGRPRGGYAGIRTASAGMVP